MASPSCRARPRCGCPRPTSSPMLNRIVGLGRDGPASEEQLDEAIAAMAGLRYYVSVSPSAQPAGDRRLAARARLRAELGLDAVPARPRAAAGRDVARDRARSARSAATEFARLVCARLRPPEALAPIIAALPGRPGWHCWLALAGDEPAAAAALYVGEGARLPRPRRQRRPSTAARARRARSWPRASTAPASSAATRSSQKRASRYPTARAPRTATSCAPASRSSTCVPNWLSPAP